jgi:hypothetical protein
MNPNHSRFGGSSAHRWMYCPYSARKEFQIPDKGGPAAKRGTAMHEAAEHIWQGRESKIASADLKTVTEYVAFLRDLFHGPDCKLEFKAHAPSIHEEAFGTIDYVDYHHGILTIVDFKTGTTPVEAVDNKQLLYYAVAVEDTLDIKPNEYRFYIWQNGTVRLWIPDAEVVVGARFVMRDAATRCEISEPVMGDWCDWCKVKNCPAKAAVAEATKGLVNW